jgi:hypothetical protein
MTAALGWFFAGMFLVLVVALGWAMGDAKRRPARWYSGPSLDERDAAAHGRSKTPR